MYGLFAKGENGQGIAINMMSNTIEYQISIVLNFSLSLNFRFVNDEPIVNTIIADNIRIICINPKKTSLISYNVSSKFFQKKLTEELFV